MPALPALSVNPLVPCLQAMAVFVALVPLRA